MKGSLWKAIASESDSEPKIPEGYQGWQSVKMQEEKEGVQGKVELSRTNQDLQKTNGTHVDKLRPLFISHCL